MTTPLRRSRPAGRPRRAAHPPAHVAVAREPSAARAILRRQINLWIWRRRLDRTLTTWLDTIGSNEPLAIKLDTVPARCGRELETALDEIGIADCVGRCLWVQDVSGLAHIFARLTDDPLRLRIDELSEERCPAFHTDSVDLRMLCTYRGPGTQWLPNPAVDRAELGLRGRMAHEANRAIARRSHVRTLRAGWVAILKGEPHPHPLVHRSAPLTPGAPSRLLLRLDRLQRP